MIKALLLYSIGFLCVEQLCRTQTHGFSLLKVSTDHKHCLHFPMIERPKELNQPFYFLSSGVQSYAFVGQDQKTVLKLFKQHHMGLFTEKLALLFPSQREKRIKRMQTLVTSAEIAHKELGQESGVFYSHLRPTQGLGKLSLYDNLGICHPLNLDTTEFVLQKKVETAEHRLGSLLQACQVDEAITSMQRLLDLIENRSKKGIKNKDGKILQNCGFDGDVPIEIDVGSYTHRIHTDNPNPHLSARKKGANQLLRFVEKNHPEYLEKCRKELFISEAPH